MIRLRVVAAGLLLMGATSSPGEDAAAIAPGTRLRVFARTLGSKPLVGVLQSLRDNALTWRPRDTRVPYLSRDRRLNASIAAEAAIQGARWAIRAGLGLLAGVAIGLARGNTCTGFELVDILMLGTCSAGTKAAIGGILGVPAGALIGLPCLLESVGNTFLWVKVVRRRRIRRDCLASSP